MGNSTFVVVDGKKENLRRKRDDQKDKEERGEIGRRQEKTKIKNQRVKIKNVERGDTIDTIEEDYQNEEQGN